jgi:RimJ/RimL family protein N-acetyltransferase
VSEDGDLRLRRASAEDAEFIASLATHAEVEPFMAVVSAKDAEAFREEIERAEREPEHYGRYVIELDGERAGTMAFEVNNRRSRIAWVYGIMVHPDFRGRRLADRAARAFARHLFDDLGFHRLELEVYGFNERALRHADRVYVREGVKRKAYWRDEEWVDGVIFGLTQEDLEKKGD